MASRIYINPDDDINTVINKVVSKKGGDIQLVVPSGSRILQNIVDAYLLRDATLARAQNVTIVTNDIMGKIFAERAGMSVVNAETGDSDFFVTETMAKMADIVPKRRGGPPTVSKRMPVRSPTKASRVSIHKLTIAQKTIKKVIGRASKKLASGRPQPKNEPSAIDESKFLRAYRKDIVESEGFGKRGFRDIRKKSSGGRFSKYFRLSTSRLVIIVLAIALVVAVFVFGKVLPKSNIVVYPLRETASFNIEVFIDETEIDVRVEDGSIPGEVFTKEEIESNDFAATGLEDVNIKASGAITIYNEFSSNPQRFIPSRFETPDGKIFWTIEGIVVPGANIEGGKTSPGSARVGVLASEPGEAYNIGPSRFTMPALKGSDRFDKFYAISEEPMSGGQTGQSVVVSQGDIDNAFANLQSKINPKLKEFRENLPEGLVLWDEAYNEEITERSSDKEAGEPSDRFNATVRTVARAITFRQDDLDLLLDLQINSRLSEDQIILPKSKEITFLKPPVIDYQKGTIFTTLQVKVDIIDNLEADVFKGAILKKNKEEIKQILPNFKGIERVEVKLWPFWVKRVPKNSDRVNVTIFGL